MFNQNYVDMVIKMVTDENCKNAVCTVVTVIIYVCMYVCMYVSMYIYIYHTNDTHNK